MNFRKAWDLGLENGETLGRIQMRPKIKQVYEEVLQEIKPNAKERKQVAQTVSTVLRTLEEEIKKSGIEARPELEGSIAHGTWISGERDIDIFILFPLSYPLVDLKRVGLEIGKKTSKGKWRERYAEHPFIEAEVDGYRIDIVPCYKISKHTEKVTSVDRTPLHTEYLSTRIGENMRDEIILLKAFMKGIGIYGAEVRINGFSGYLCELLVLHYGSFEDVLKNGLGWTTSEVIDIEKHYEDHEMLKTVFTEPLILIDPVDPGRNVAAAVSNDRIADLKSAARAFFENPSAKFFRHTHVKPMNETEMIRLLEDRSTDTLFIQLPCEKISPDIIWGELKKSSKALRKLLEKYDFEVMNSGAWSDEGSTSVMVMELSSANLPDVKVHVGPLAGDPNQRKFLSKHLYNEKKISGPWVENGRWHVELKRGISNAKQLVESKLKDANLTDIGLSRDVVNWLKRGGKVLENKEILAFYASSESFAEFLTCFYVKKPSWLQ
jgi:tRNA nucleotidyltransferase (CCA-adding enzyme)